MTPQMKEERPVPSGAQVKATLDVQANWKANPSDPPPMRFFEYGDNIPKGVNPTADQVSELVNAVRGSD